MAATAWMQSLIRMFRAVLIARYFGLAALEDLSDVQRPLPDLGADHERAPHRDRLAVGHHGLDRLVEVEVDARLGPGAEDLHVQRPRVAS